MSWLLTKSSVHSSREKKTPIFKLVQTSKYYNPLLSRVKLSLSHFSEKADSSEG